MKHKEKLIPALLEKANAQELCNRLSNSDRFNNTDTKYKSDLERFEQIPDNHTSVDLEIRFHTIAKYIGLICANDVDFFSETRDPFLVNQDKQEDLLIMCKLFDLIPNTSVPGTLTFKQPLFRVLKKNQIIKTIPYFFKQENGIDFDTES